MGTGLSAWVVLGTTAGGIRRANQPVVLVCRRPSFSTRRTFFNSSAGSCLAPHQEIQLYPVLLATLPQAVIFDEAHVLKNNKAQVGHFNN